MSSIRYVCGADIAFDGGMKYACCPMAVCETPEEAAVANADLHSSFGHAIYKIDFDDQKTVTLCYGFRMGAKATGWRVLELVGQSFDIPKPISPA